jgi:hypothetical protein
VSAVDELTDGRIELDAEVSFPPFPLWLRIPGSWSRLDSNPQTWRRSAEQLIDGAFRGSRLSARDRRSVLEMLEGMVADCQRAGAALSLLTVGRRASGGAASFGLHLAFASDGRPTSLGRVHDMLPRSGTTIELATGCGPAVLHRDRVTMVVPGTAEIVTLSSIQIFLPIRETTWTVVLSTASAFADLTGALEELVCAVAESISTGEPGPDGDGAPRTEVAADLGRPDDWVPAGRDTPDLTAGFERGFNTLVLRRLDAPEKPSLPGRSGPAGAFAGQPHRGGQR